MCRSRQKSLDYIEVFLRLKFVKALAELVERNLAKVEVTPFCLKEWEPRVLLQIKKPRIYRGFFMSEI